MEEAEMPATHLTLSELFWRKVNKNGPIPKHCPAIGQCWIWTACTNDRGYGRLAFMEKRNSPHFLLAHRASWKIHFGELPEIHVLHKCDNPPCVRPSHLFIGTDADNVHDRIRKGRSAKGERIPSHVVTEKNVIEIDELSSQGFLQADIAKKFGIAISTVSCIIHRKRWKHVPRKIIGQLP